jgi:hypothetical protein
MTGAVVIPLRQLAEWALVVALAAVAVLRLTLERIGQTLRGI